MKDEVRAADGAAAAEAPAPLAARDAPTHVVCVSGAFYNARGQVLLVRDARRGWEPPGGQVEAGEDPVAALVREAREESGCEVMVERLVSVGTRVTEPYMVLFMFAGRCLGGTPGAGDGTVDAGWFTVEQALQLVTWPPAADRLRDAVQRPGLTFRTYRERPYRAEQESTLRHVAGMMPRDA